jgi:hypothetical protein
LLALGEAEITTGNTPPCRQVAVEPLAIDAHSGGREVKHQVAAEVSARVSETRPAGIGEQTEPDAP